MLWKMPQSHRLTTMHSSIQHALFLAGKLVLIHSPEGWDPDWPFLLLPRALVVPALHKVTGRVNRIPYKSVAQAHCCSLLSPY